MNQIANPSSAAASKNPAGETALFWISWIGGFASLAIALIISTIPTKITLLVIAVLVLGVAFFVTIRRYRREPQIAAAKEARSEQAARASAPVLTDEELKIRTALVNGRFREMQDDGSFPIEYHDIDTTDAARELAAQGGFQTVDGKLVLVDRVFADWQHTRGQN